MPNNRLTAMNQWGDIIYRGFYKKGDYRGIGDYPENLSIKAIEEIMTKLYWFEETFEALEERMRMIYGERNSN